MCEQNLVKYKLQINMWNKDLKLQNIYDNLYHHQGFFQINLTICEKWWYCSPRWTEGWSMRSRSWSIKLWQTLHYWALVVAVYLNQVPVAKCCHLVTILMTGRQTDRWKIYDIIFKYTKLLVLWHGESHVARTKCRLVGTSRCLI